MKLTHPNSTQTVEPADGDVELYRSQGWVPVEPKQRPAKKRATSSGDATTTDPAA